MTIRIGYICPTYQEESLHDYTLRALESFFKYTADGVALVVDDASPGWSDKIEADIGRVPRFPGQDVHIHRYAEWGGLTRSWNQGMRMARELNLDYVIAGNNDVLFTRFWYEGLLHALEHGYKLVGPISNAPGITALGHAEVDRYVANYQTTDDPAYINEVADALRAQYAGKVIPAKVNGFFQLAKTAVWWQGRYDDEHVYKPRNDFNSHGKPNPTPLMTLNEDELQGRWNQKGWQTAVVPSSFIFHYRAVARGNAYRRGKWHRLTDPKKGV